MYVNIISSKDGILWPVGTNENGGRVNQGKRKIPVGPDSIAGLQARSCILAVEGAEAVIERKRQQHTVRLKEKGSEF